jgi:putative ABC transport system permease protein
VNSPGLAVAAIVTLGLAIGAGTAIFSVVKAVLLAPLPFQDARRLVQITGRSDNGHPNWVVYRDLADWRERCRTFDSIGAANFALLNLTGDGEPEALYGAAFSSELFGTLGTRPILGRAFLPSDDRPGQDQVVILSYSLWQRRFGGDPSIVGKKIKLSGPRLQDREVIGVMPPDFNFPLSIPSAVEPPSRQMAFWVPIGLDPVTQSRDGPGCMAVARLRSGVSLVQAQSDIDAVTTQLGREYPETNAGRKALLTPLLNHALGSTRMVLLAIWAATSLVLLIGCVNIANLLLARATNRTRDNGIRLALGADRRRLVRQWLTESLMLAVLGGGAGILLAATTLHLILKLAPRDIPRINAARIDIAVLICSIGVAVLTGFFFGALPAWRAATADPSDALREGAARGTGPGGGRARGLLIVAEVALCVPLAVGAMLFVRSYARLISVDIGYHPDHVLTSIILLQNSRYPSVESKIAFYRHLIERLEQLPGVEAAGAANGVPLSGNFGPAWITVEGRQSTAQGDDRPSADEFCITPDYLKAVGIRLMRGRPFTRQDTESGLRPVVVNEPMAEEFWPNDDPIGKRLSFTGVDKEREWRMVVGIAKATRDYSLDLPPRPAIYVPIEQTLATPQILTVRTSVSDLDLTSDLRRAVADLDKEQPIFVITSMQTLVDNSVAPRRYCASMLSIFGALAVVLAAVGVYGVVSYTTSRRTQEIGLRVAIGASRTDVFRLILWAGMTRALAGLAIGLAAALICGRLIASLLYAVSPVDPLALGGSSMLLLGVALAASYIPARRAMRVDPMTALREG